MPTDKELLNENWVKSASISGSPDTDIAAAIGCTPESLRRRFGTRLNRWRAHGRILIRSWQFAAARKLNVTILIWLGRNFLGQSLEGSKESDDEPDSEIKQS